MNDIRFKIGNYMRVLIINGPNLGKLGERQPEIYGNQSMNAVTELVKEIIDTPVDMEIFQSNHEGEIIDRLEKAHEEYLAKLICGVVLNAGAFTHTSLAIGDCLAWIKIPVVEVHLSNVYARAQNDSIRGISFTTPHCMGTISGFGMKGYVLGVQALLNNK